MNARRAATALAVALGLLAIPGIAQARPLPTEAVQKAALLTTGEMISSAGYSGTLIAAGAASCYATDDGGRDCMLAAQPGSWDNPANYPYGNYITALPTMAAANTLWKTHMLAPKPYSGETITIVTKTAKLITWYAAPADASQMAWSFTAIKGKQGIMSANCGANTLTPDYAALAECSAKVAKALAAKVKKVRPTTPLA